MICVIDSLNRSLACHADILHRLAFRLSAFDLIHSDVHHPLRLITEIFPMTTVAGTGIISLPVEHGDIFCRIIILFNENSEDFLFYI